MTNPESTRQPILRTFLFVSEAAERDFKSLPIGVQKDFGHELHEIQLGEEPRKAKALNGFSGASVMELLTDDQDGTYRAMYTVKFGDLLYLLHAFQKKSKSGIATSKTDMEKVSARFREAERDYQLRLQGGKK